MPILPKYFGLVPAGGAGHRFGAENPKQYANLGGRTVLEHSVAALLVDTRIEKVFVVLAPHDTAAAQLFAQNSRVELLALAGKERVNTVLNALNYLLQNGLVNDTDWLLVHDAARPGLPANLLADLIEQASAHVAGGFLAVPVADTLKRAAVVPLDEDEPGQADQQGNVNQYISQATVARLNMWCAQTPQMFRAQALSLALCECLYKGMEVTDEASAIEAMGISPLIVQGSLLNMKITHCEDLQHIARLMGVPHD